MSSFRTCQHHAPMKTEETFVYFIRHGESVDNLSKIFQGPDSDLTELGHRQASSVAERMKNTPVEVILTSPMRRAAKTAEYIREATNLPLESHDMFREYLAPSELLGTPHADPSGQSYLTALRAHYDDPMFRYADEDTYFDLHERALHVLRHLVERAEHHIAVVTHAGFMRVIIAAMLAEGVPDPTSTHRMARFFASVNTGVTICKYCPNEKERNKWRLLCWNDHAHLLTVDKEESAELLV